MKKYIIIAMLLISNFSFFGKVNKEELEENNMQETLQNVEVLENQIIEEQ